MNTLFLTLLFPLIGFLLLAFSRGRWSETTAALIGVTAGIVVHRRRKAKR